MSEKHKRRALKLLLTTVVVGSLLGLYLSKRGRIRIGDERPTVDGRAESALTPSPITGAVAAHPSESAAALPLRRDLQWQRPIPEPAFAGFAEWTQRYVAAPTREAKAVLEAEGVALARARLIALADRIQSDPQRALELALPRSVREAMPDSVKELLEESVNVVGEYQVQGILPLPGAESPLPPVLRSTVIGGKSYQVFTFGRGLSYLTRRSVPLNGIAVPASAATAPPSNPLLRPDRLMALDPNPARQLEPGEIAVLKAAQGTEAICGVTGRSWSSDHDETALELGGEIHTFCGKVHAEHWLSGRIAALGLDTPSGDAGESIAYSSYTEGRKRMLLMRPIFSDYSNVMSTNAALTHFNNFGNYMSEMSNAKLVLAGIGQGSDITPAMLLPGVVADYDNTGLGRLYNTCRDVAAADYGYDLSQYDFLYVCTLGRPAASYAGVAFVGGVGFHLANGYFDAAVSSHEFGHNLGLHHAHFWDTQARSVIGSGQNVEYGDNNDPMGGGGSPNSYNARYKNYLGWIAGNDIADLTVTGSGRYRLYAFDLNASVGLRGLKFRRTSSQNYWLNFRQRKTSRKALMNGAQLMWTGNGNEGSYVLDVRLKGSADDNAIVIGRTFSDTNVALHVTPLGKGHTYPESLDLRVNIGQFPGNRPPVAKVSASTINAGQGQLITFTVNATDPDGDALAYYWEFGDGADSYSFDNNPVQTHSFAGVGEYAVRCDVSDMKGGTARHTVIVRVGNPNTFRITGRVHDTKNRAMAGIRVRAGSRSVYTDSDGSYTLAGLPAGAYNVQAFEPVSGAMSFVDPYFDNPVTVGPNRSGADFVGVQGSLNIYTPFSPKLATWKYLDNGSDQGTSWQQTNFNDSAWASGPGVLGYGQGGEGTVISYGTNANNKHITYYFRRRFVVNNPSAFTNLLLETRRDDGVIVYLNGMEVFRNNMPTGTVTYLTHANDTVEPDSYLQATLDASLLVPGTNLLAAEIHQAEPTSSDLAFDAGLSALSVSNATGFTLVYISDPPDHTSFASPTNVTIEAAAYSGGTVSLMEFYADGAKIGEDDNAPYSFDWQTPANGAHVLAVVASIGSMQVTSPPVRITISEPVPPSLSLSLVETGAVWRFLAGPSAAPPTWASQGFDDSGWSNGPAQLGFGEGDERTVVPGGPGSSRYTTIYFRHSFIVSDPGAVTNLSLRLLRDDGAVVYVNGAEVVRDNLPSGTVSYGTLATNALDDGQAFLGFVLDPAVLTVGSNLIAVEVHQSSLNSSDLSFDLAVDAVSSTNRTRGIWLTAPADGSTVSLPGSATLTAQVVAGGILGVRKVEFFADGVKLGEDTASPFSFVWNDPGGGPHVLVAIATDTEGDSIASDPVNITVTPPPVGTALISFGELWKYLDDGSNQGTNWVRRTFDDRMWMAGSAKLGYGGDGEITRVSYGTNPGSKHITTYFRKAFTVVNPTVFNRLVLRLVRDDGAVVYLNGAEVYRNNIDAGPVSWNSLASAAVDGTGESAPVEATLSTIGLLAGANVLAVEMHQASIGSSDLGFDLALAGLEETNTARGIYVASPANGARFNLPANVSLSAYAATESPVVQVEYFAGTTRIGEAAAHPYRYTWSSAPAGSHVLTAVVTDSGGLQLTSPPVAITIGRAPPPIAPVFSTLITSGSAWRFWDSTVAVGTGWERRDFDDRPWQSGVARFGWGLDGERTTLTDGRVTHYFRRWFNVVNPALLSELIFELVRDDGAVVYLNGVEVYRSNMPSGPISASTPASSTVNTPDETTWYETTLATAGSGLLSGTNLVAVELHQGSATSSDASFDFALYGMGTTERRIYVSAPANGALVPNTSPILIEAAAGAGSGSIVSRVEFFADGVKLGEATSAPYRFEWDGAPFGTHVLMARLIDNSGTGLDSASVTITVTREPVTLTLISVGSVWTYLDDGSDQGTNWALPGYNPSAWAAGPARLGYGDDGEVTQVSFGTNPNAKYITTYFRRAFSVPANAAITNLLFRLLRDDGAVVWLNGRELFRGNMPPAAVNYMTTASAAVSGADEQTFFSTTLTVTKLPHGTNFVAVEIHQNAADSSDLAFDLELIGSGYLEFTTPPTLAIERFETQLRLSWSASYTGWSVYSTPALSSAASWTRLSNPVVVVDGRNTVIFTPAGAQEFYRLERP